MPSVEAAIRIAAILDATVEELFSTAPRTWAPVSGDGPEEGDPVRAVMVGERLIVRRLRPGARGSSWEAPNGVIEGGRVSLLPGADAHGALVAGCDPALGLLEELSASRGGMRTVGVSASSGDALAALAEGRAHAALVHAAPERLPEPPVPVTRIHFARWRVGLAVRPAHRLPGVEELLSGSPVVVQREASATSQDALVDATARLGLPPPKGPIAAGHLDAARRARESGAPAVTMEPASIAWGLQLVPIDTHAVELWIADEWLEHPAVAALCELVRSRALRGRLEALGGYDLDHIGEPGGVG